MSEKTEKPTQKRLQKAREEGQFPVSRGLVSAVQFLAFLIALGAWARSWFEDVEAVTFEIFRRAFRPEFTQSTLTEVSWLVLLRIFLPLAAGGVMVLVAPFAVQLAMTRFGFSMKPLLPSGSKLNPISKLTKLPKQNAAAVLQAIAVLTVCAAAAYWIAGSRAEKLFALPLTPFDIAKETVFSALSDLLWDAAAILVVAGAIDFVWQRFRFNKQMRMSRQEIRDEFREVEGNPQLKARMRRMRRDTLRRRMMKRVREATVVIVNPTHYAIALKYDAGTRGAPVLIAKGRNYLALRIRTLAESQRIPVVENPPLARALYKFVPLGAEIPNNLYRAVADVLAYIYKHVGVRG